MINSDYSQLPDTWTPSLRGLVSQLGTNGVMTRPVVTTCLTTLNVMREQRELDGVSRWIVLPTYTLFLFVYVYA